MQRWRARDATRDTDRTAKAFCVPVGEIREHNFDLSINRYKQVVSAQLQYDPPQKILAELKALEAEITRGIEELQEMLK